MITERELRANYSGKGRKRTKKALPVVDPLPMQDAYEAAMAKVRAEVLASRRQQ